MSSIGKKVSSNTQDTYYILDGAGKNMKLAPVPMSEHDCGSNLTQLHIMNIRVNGLGWQALSRGLEHHNCVLELLKINLVEFDRDSLSALADGLRKNSSLSVLDFSYNNLNDSFGDIFGKIISM